MDKYNLTWKEAKEAMKRGAVVENEFNMKNFYFKEGLFFDKSTHWVIPDRVYFSIREAKYSIVELTDCHIISNSENSQYTCCSTHETISFNDNERLTLKCIIQFTEQLKEDMEKQA